MRTRTPDGDSRGHVPFRRVRGRLRRAALLGVLVREHGSWTPSDALLLVIAGLLYDNTVLAVGRSLGTGPLLESLNAGRFWLHALLTPLLVVFGWHAMARAGYEPTDPVGGPPIMVLGVLVVLLVAAVIVWWKQRWPWFAVGVVLMGIGSATPVPVDSAAVTNAFEFVLLVSLLATKQHQDRATEAGAAAGRGSRRGSRTA